MGAGGGIPYWHPQVCNQYQYPLCLSVLSALSQLCAALNSLDMSCCAVTRTASHPYHFCSVCSNNLRSAKTTVHHEHNTISSHMLDSLYSVLNIPQSAQHAPHSQLTFIPQSVLDICTWYSALIPSVLSAQHCRHGSISCLCDYCWKKAVDTGLLIGSIGAQIALRSTLTFQCSASCT